MLRLGLALALLLVAPASAQEPTCQDVVAALRQVATAEASQTRDNYVYEVARLRARVRVLEAQLAEKEKK